VIHPPGSGRNQNNPMPEIALCRNPCAACADFTPLEERFIRLARVVSIQYRHPDEVFASLLFDKARQAAAAKNASTKKLSKGN
jgi:hypothetical protein